MKSLLFPVAMTVILLFQATRANADDDSYNEVLFTAELTFATASFYLGATNGHQGYMTHCSVPACVLGVGVGVTSLVLSTAHGAEIEALDVAAGVVAIVGSSLRFPRATSIASNNALGSTQSSRGNRSVEMLVGPRQLGIRVGF